MAFIDQTAKLGGGRTVLHDAGDIASVGECFAGRVDV
jgi:hypothetical protein